MTRIILLSGPEAVRPLSDPLTQFNNREQIFIRFGFVGFCLLNFFRINSRRVLERRIVRKTVDQFA